MLYIWVESNVSYTYCAINYRFYLNNIRSAFGFKKHSLFRNIYKWGHENYVAYRFLPEIRSPKDYKQ